jgi:hypothetical protein
MYITGLGVIDKSREKKKAAKTGAAGFSELVSNSEIEDAQLASTPAVGSTSSLFFLQEIGDDAQQRREFVTQGFDALKYLDSIKIGLLYGTLSRDTLISLESLLGRFKKNFPDPKLSQVIEEIELRAKVEIAKLDRN